MAWSTKRIVGVVLISVMAFLLLAGGGVFLIVRTVTSVIKNSEPYRATEELIRESEIVAESLGTIQKFGWFPSGSNIHVTTGSGNAVIAIRVYGEKGSGRVQAGFVKEGDKWFLIEANLYLSGGGEGLPLLPLEISSMTFHSGSQDGPVNEARDYKTDETIYWTLIVEKASSRGGKISLREGIRILDANNNPVVENPDLVIFEEETKGAVTFTNHAVLPDPGFYTIRIEVEDRLTHRQAVRADTVSVSAPPGE